MPDLIVKSYEVSNAFKIAEMIKSQKQGECYEITVVEIDEDSVMQVLWEIKHTLPSNFYKIVVQQTKKYSYKNTRKFNIIIKKINTTSSATPLDSVTVAFTD